MAQRGWITKQDRKKKGPVWVYHWYVIKPETGKEGRNTPGRWARLPASRVKRMRGLRLTGGT